MPNWLTEFPEEFYINIKDPIDQAIRYMIVNWSGFFDGLSAVLRMMLKGISSVINLIPWWMMILAVFALTFYSSRRLLKALLYSVLLFFIGCMGLWPLMYMTLTIVAASVIISLLLGVPIGVLMSFSVRSEKIVRPVLDTMQTMPSFVYLIPAVMLLGLGNVPAVIATTIYAMPPVIRLTSHGIRQVDREIVEAAHAFGSTRLQTLFKVQMPQAMPTIMTGVNQTIMMAISMVVTCSMIGATGLGSEVIMGINRLESGRGFAAGIAIVILAVILDRLTQNFIKRKDDEVVHLG
jgi:ABC-type proline/glycine betaine transport system permease subunit